MTNGTKPSDFPSFEQDDMRFTLTTLCKTAFANSTAHGFWDEYWDMIDGLESNDWNGSAAFIPKYTIDVKLSKIALMHSELGEMTEGVRKPCGDQHCTMFTSEEIELADVLIRAFDYAGAFGLRLAGAVLAKMEYNASRPYKHGKGA